jgi:hypothetical protein
MCIEILGSNANASKPVFSLKYAREAKTLAFGILGMQEKHIKTQAIIHFLFCRTLNLLKLLYRRVNKQEDLLHQHNCSCFLSDFI